MSPWTFQTVSKDQALYDILQMQEAMIAKAEEDHPGMSGNVSVLHLKGYCSMLGALWERFICQQLGITSEEWSDAIERLL